MIEYTIKALVESGLCEIVIVVGYKASMIRRALGEGWQYGARITYVVNRRYEQGNAVSLYAARQAVGDEPFLVTMSDHLIGPEIPQALRRTGETHSTLCIDHRAHAPPQVNDATRVWAEDGHIVRIGKDIVPWNAIDTGVFRFAPHVFQAIASLLDLPGGPSLSQTVTRLIVMGHPVRACDVSGAWWTDVDTLEDLWNVEAELTRCLEKAA
jgi:choline kinase